MSRIARGDRGVARLRDSGNQGVAEVGGSPSGLSIRSKTSGSGRSCAVEPL